jgi:hypothetical protein
MRVQIDESWCDDQAFCVEHGGGVEWCLADPRDYATGNTELSNNNTNQPYSMHPHGVFYNKDSEGSPYRDGTSGKDKADDGVASGQTHEYVWQVPDRAGPGPMDGDTVMWMYHSHVEEVKDPNTGLMGPMIVTARGKAKADGSPSNIDREILTMFAQMHEEDSWYAARNMPTLMKDEPTGRFPPQQSFYPYFVTFSINGLWQPAAQGGHAQERTTGPLVRLLWHERLRCAHAALARERRHHQSDAHRRGMGRADADDHR